MDFNDSMLNASTKKKKKKDKQHKSYRFELSLQQSNDSACPEFSYIDLVKEVSKKSKSLENGNISTSNGSKEQSEAEALASYYEKKYGGGSVSSTNKRRRDRAQDLADVGYGYDETDPFVDNSECYDEVIPSSLTTQFGGFYINSGKLEFKTVSDDSNWDQRDDEDDDEDSLPLSAHIRKTKHRLSDESSDDFRDTKDVAKRKKRKGSNEQIEKRRRKLSLQGKEKLGKLRKSAKKKHSKVQLLVAKAKAQHHLSSSGTDKSACSKAANASSSQGMNNSKKAATSMDTEKDLLDFLDQQHTATLNENHSDGSSPDIPLKALASKLAKPEIHHLPQSIPANIADKISSLTKIAKTNENEGKVKFFSPDVNKLLLGIETGSQSLSNRERSGIYEHLTPHVPCSKDTLIKRMKKLHTSKQDETLKEPLERLKRAIDGVMEEQIKLYDEECAAQLLAKSDDRSALAASTDEDDDGTGAPPGGEEKMKRTYAPRRKFKWNDTIRQLMFDVVKIKLQQYGMTKHRSNQSAEDYLKTFLENEVKVLWPKGWMQARMLFKESRQVHQEWTGNMNKQKKVMLGASKAKVGPNSKLDKKATSGAPGIASSLSGAVGSLASAENINERNSTKASKQLFKDHDSSLSVTLNLDCSGEPENVPLFKNDDSLHRMLPSTQKEASRSKTSASKEPAQSKQPIAKDMKVAVQKTPLGMSSASRPGQNQIATVAAKSLSNAELQQRLATWNDRQVASTVTNKNITATNRASSETLAQKSSVTPPPGKQQIKTTSNKSAPVIHLSPMDHFSAELMKLAMMVPNNAAQQVPMDSQMLAMLSSLGYPPVLPTSSLPAVPLEELNKYMKIQQAALQPSAAYSTYPKNLKKNSPTAKLEQLHRGSSSSKKSVPFSTGPKQASAKQPSDTEATRQSQLTSKPPSNVSHPNVKAEGFKLSVNGNSGYAESIASGASTANVTKAKPQHKNQSFVAPGPPGRYMMTQPARAESAHDVFYPKSRTSPLTVSSAASQLAGSSQTARSKQVSPVATPFKPIYPFHSNPPYSVASPFGAASLPGAPSSRAPSNSVVSSGVPEHYLKFNQLMDAASLSKAMNPLDLDKAAMDALLSAQLQASRR